ncbi:MAG: Lrp/AsnC family transcriptional regulator [Eubacteriales bacterium]|nr:Lrp/AsnC family transcriptional regulator [Eubacteriales bacterium]
MLDVKKEIVEILAKDARTPHSEMAVLLGISQEQVAELVRQLEEEKIIVCYTTVVDWNRISGDQVQALIEVRVTPQRDRGFDAIAQRIYGFSEVKSVYLMSGGYDLTVLVEGNSMKEVAFFVAEKLSTIDGVLSTATHFVLRKYKDNGVFMDFDENGDSRLAVSP